MLKNTGVVVVYRESENYSKAMSTRPPGCSVTLSSLSSLTALARLFSMLSSEVDIFAARASLRESSWIR